MIFDGIPPCAAPGVDPDLWFSENRDEQEAAVWLCATCPFQGPCAELREQPFSYLDTAWERAEFGTWAGVTLVPPRIEERRLAEIKDPTPRQRKTMEQVEQVRGLLHENLGKTEMGRRLGLSHGSINHIIKNYLTPEEATA